MDSITFNRPIPRVTICSQVWTTRNLDVTTYNDGTQIPQVTDPTAWANLTTGAWCFYNNDPTNNAVYGKLYNWYAAAGIYDAASLANPALRKNLAPSGWHVPTDSEWFNLIDCLDPNANGGTNGNMAGGAMKETGTTHWTSPNTDATNSSGFNGLPGGFRGFNGASVGIGNYSFWWSSSEFTNTNAWYCILNYNSGFANTSYPSKLCGGSVRCVKD